MTQKGRSDITAGEGQLSFHQGCQTPDILDSFWHPGSSITGISVATLGQMLHNDGKVKGDGRRKYNRRAENRQDKIENVGGTQ